MTKWMILSIHCVKTVLLCVINYFQSQGGISYKYEINVYSKIELWCKIVVEIYMYPLFLYCYIYFVSRHKKQLDGGMSLQKILVIMWIYFLFFLNVLYNVYSVMFRLIRVFWVIEQPWFLILHAFMYSFYQPLKDFLTSLTLLYLVYTQCA